MSKHYNSKECQCKGCRLYRPSAAESAEASRVKQIKDLESRIHILEYDNGILNRDYISDRQKAENDRRAIFGLEPRK